MKSHSHLLLLFVVAFVFRFLILFLGYHGDLNNQISWGEIVFQRGTIGFYELPEWPYSAPNQPPITILLLGLMSFAWHSIHNLSWYLNNTISFFPSAFIWFWEQKGVILMMKLPGILADVGIGWLIYTYVKNAWKDKKKALFLCAIWLFNPIVWYNSSIWGQTDSIVNILGLLSVFTLLKKKLRWSMVWFTCSILFKGSLSYFAPLFLVVGLFQNYTWKEWSMGILWSIVLTTLVSLPFHPYPDFLFWLSNLYTNRFIPGEIGYLTANAFNFWWLVDSGKTYDTALYFGIPARIWGFLPVLLVMLWNIRNLKKGVNDKNVFFSLALLAFTIFLFMTRIHERYLYPFFPYATLLLLSMPRMWVVYLLISFVHLLNLYNLFWVPPIPFLENALTNTQFTNGLSLILLFSYLVFLFLSKREKLYNT